MLKALTREPILGKLLVGHSATEILCLALSHVVSASLGYHRITCVRLLLRSSVSCAGASGAAARRWAPNETIAYVLHALIFASNKSCKWESQALGPGQTSYWKTRRTKLQIQVDPNQLSSTVGPNVELISSKWILDCKKFDSWIDRRLTPRRSSDVLPVCNRRKNHVSVN